MKKRMIVLPLAVLMLSLTATIASAGVDWEDPVLCVNGQWLLVDAAKTSAVTVWLPVGTRYGDQAAGGCASNIPFPLITNVRVRGKGDEVHVQVDGKFASTPTVKAQYGEVAQIRRNNRHEELNFRFDLPPVRPPMLPSMIH